MLSRKTSITSLRIALTPINPVDQDLEWTSLLLVLVWPSSNRQRYFAPSAFRNPPRVTKEHRPSDHWSEALIRVARPTR